MDRATGIHAFVISTMRRKWRFEVIGILCCFLFYFGWESTSTLRESSTALTKFNQHDEETIIQPTRKEVFVDDTKMFPNKGHILSLYKNVCHAYGGDIDIEQPWTQFKSIVLVVLFNHPLYRLIPMVELLYRPFFPRIVYCIADGEKDTEIKKWNLTIVLYNSPGGGHNYICVHYVHLLGLKAAGFLFMADDLLIPPSIVANFPMSLPVAPHISPKACHIYGISNPRCKAWVHFKAGSQSLLSMWAENKKESNQSLGNRCTRAMQNLTGAKDPIPYDLADVYFIPSSFMDDASELFRKFHKHNVFLEIAVVSVLGCLAWPSMPTRMDGVAKWGRDRDQFYKFLPSFITERKTYLHPVKLSLVLKGDREYAEPFCRSLLPYYHKRPLN